MKIPFHRAYISDEEISSVSDVLRSGWLTMGEKTFEFERNFSAYTGAEHSIAVNSCTSALHLALKTAGIKPGDEVIIPAMTFIATWEIITYLQAVPVLADAGKDTFTIDPADLERKITPRTRAVIPVHYGGECCDMGRIKEIAGKHGLCIIEDAAHALPARYRGRMAGTIGDMTCFSFYATKTLTTGEGGMVTTGDSEKADRMRRLRLHGITRDAWNRYSDKGTWQYDVSEAGYKYNMTDIASAIGIEQLKKCDNMNTMRHEIAAVYNDAFSRSELVSTWGVRDFSECAWHLYPLRINTEALSISRDEFIIKLRNTGIGTSVHYIPLYRFSCFDRSVLKPGDFPGCEDIFRREVSLPVYPGMSDAETGYVIENVLDILSAYKR